MHEESRRKIGKLKSPKSHASLKKILVKQFGRVQSVIKEQLRNLPQRFSITCDVWTDSGLKNAYLGIEANRSSRYGGAFRPGDKRTN
uniref:Transposase n=1 Tax=Ditylenchus dipsaci TaxID=166011 RepID=A0A915DM77_9BILA